MTILVQAITKLQAITEKTGVTPKIVHDVILNNVVLIPDGTYRSIIGELIADGEGTYDCIVFRSDKMQRSPVRLTNDYVGNLIKGMNEVIGETPYRISYHVGHRDIITTELYESLLLKHPNSGLISIVPQNVDVVSDVCQRHNRPCIFIDLQGRKVLEHEYVINVSNYESIKQAMHHLLDLGHRQIGFITGMLSMTSAVERLRGYRETLDKAQIPYDPILVVEGNWSPQKAYELTLQLLRLPERPTAILASNDIMASGAIVAIRELGLKIPDDISVVGFDDIPMAEDILLTTVRQPVATLGMKAVELMIALLNKDNVTQHEYEYVADLVIRKSTGQAH